MESVPNIGSIFAVLPNSCVFLTGALHFVAYTWGNDDDNFILSFEVNDEVFRDIRLPENYLDEFYSKFDHHVHQLVVFNSSRECWLWLFLVRLRMWMKMKMK